MNFLTVDFETYYSKDYSLTKLTTEEYIRSPLFEIIGVGVKVSNAPATWCSGSHEEIKQYLTQFDIPNSTVIAHNTRFDGALLAWILGLTPKFLIDTMSMARPHHWMNVGGSLAALAKHYNLGEKGTDVQWAMGKRRSMFSAYEMGLYKQYCRNDTELTYKLFKELLKKTTVEELRVIDMTLRMFTDPKLLLSKEIIIAALNKVVTEKQNTLEKVKEFCNLADLSSNNKFAEVLRKFQVEIPLKVSPATSKATFAFAKTDEGFQSLLNNENTVIQTLAAARVGVKSTLEEKRLERFISIAENGPLPVPLQYCGAGVTWRWAGADKINLQNLTSNLRSAIYAPPGYVICSADSASIELRVNHTFCGQADSIQAFREGRDLYKEFASILYKLPIEVISPAQRFMGKVAELMLQYGAGPDKFADTCRIRGVKISPEDGFSIVNTWRLARRSIVEMGWRNCQTALAKILSGEFGTAVDANNLVVVWNNGLVTPPHHFITYEDLEVSATGEYTYTDKGKKRKIYGGKVLENICQHVARNIIAEQALKINERYPVVLLVHDEIVWLAPESEADEALKFGVDIMKTSPTWWPELPLDAKGGYAKCLGDCK